MVRRLHLPLAFVAAASASLVACDSPRESGGYRVVTGRDAGPRLPDATAEGTFDAGFGEWPDATTEGWPDAWTEGWPDAEAPWDGGFGRDATVPDFGFPEWPDATTPDVGFPRDAGPRDSGPRDSGVPPFDAGVDAGPQVQTEVVLVGASTLTLDTRPGAPADPLAYSVMLQYDNAGPGSQNISVTSASGSLLIVTQNFSMGSAHLAPVGQSTQTVAKIPGSGDTDVSSIALIACGAGLPVLVTINLSNGLVLTDLPTLTCLQ